MDGKDTLEGKPWDFLLGLKLAPRIYDNSVKGYYSYVRGAIYRETKSQEVLLTKTPGHRVLLIPEPANKHDPNAIAIFAAGKTDSGAWVNTHVGYVERDLAGAWMTGWPHNDQGKLLIVEGEFELGGKSKTPRIVTTSTAWGRR